MACWWTSLGPAEASAWILTAYKVRIDDAYAAKGILRGMNKRQLDEYASDPWSEPSADLLRFVARGSEAGALPPWWSQAHTDRLATMPSLLGWSMRSSEEPCDILEHGGQALLSQVRHIGDLFEGPPPWGTSDRRLERDRVKSRSPPARTTNSVPCLRCRGPIEDVLTRGVGHTAPWASYGDYTTMPAVTCPFCRFQGECPKCLSGAIEEGRCIACSHRPQLYKSCDSSDAKLARLGVENAVKLGIQAPELEWVALYDQPLLLLAGSEEIRQLRSEDGVEFRGAGHVVKANADDHLNECEDPHLLKQKEAKCMLHVGIRLIQRVLGLSEAMLASAAASGDYASLAHLVSVSESEVPLLKGGGQLVVDAFIADEKVMTESAAEGKSVLATITLGLMMTRSMEESLLEGFYGTLRLLELVQKHFLSQLEGHRGPMADDLAQCLDELIEIMPPAGAAGVGGRTTRFGALADAADRKFRARLMMLRSYQQLRRHDISGSRADLDTAIELDGSLVDMRISMRLGPDDVGAREDLQRVIDLAHGDERFFADYLYAMAALCAQGDSQHPRNWTLGKQFFDRAEAARARHRYFYGIPRGQRLGAASQQTAVGAYKTIARRMFSDGAFTPNASDGSLTTDELNEAIAMNMDGRGQAARQESEGTFDLGALVVIQGLVGTPQYNGELGYVEGELIQGRYPIALASNRSKKLKIKPANLRASVLDPANVSPAVQLPPDAPPVSASSPTAALFDQLGESMADALGRPKARPATEQERTNRLEMPRQERERIRTLIAACTNVAYNEAHPFDDGDQSFARACLPSDPGMKLKEARVTGMDFRPAYLSPFALACAMGQLGTVETALSMARRSSDEQLKQTLGAALHFELLPQYDLVQRIVNSEIHCRFPPRRAARDPASLFTPALLHRRGAARMAHTRRSVL